MDMREKLTIGQKVKMIGVREGWGPAEVEVVAFSGHDRCPIVVQDGEGTAYTFQTDGESQLGYFRLQLPPRKVSAYCALWRNSTTGQLKTYTEVLPSVPVKAEGGFDEFIAAVDLDFEVPA